MTLSELLIELNNRIAAAKVSGFWTDAMKKEWINMAVDRIVNFKNWKVLETKITATTIKNQEKYTHPATLKTNSIFMIKVDGEIYIKKSWVEYQDLKTKRVSDKIFSIYGGEIYINPTPTETGKTIEIFGFKRPLKLTMEDYKTGTVAVTNGSPNVVGTNTAWTASMVGKRFRVDSNGVWYTILSVTNATNLVLTENYSGVTASGEAYTIGDLLIPSTEFDEAIIKLALAICLQKERRYNEAMIEINEVEAPANPNVPESGGILSRLSRREDEGDLGFCGLVKSSRWL